MKHKFTNLQDARAIKDGKDCIGVDGNGYKRRS